MARQEYRRPKCIGSCWGPGLIWPKPFPLAGRGRFKPSGEDGCVFFPPGGWGAVLSLIKNANFFSPPFLECTAIDTNDHDSFLNFPSQVVLDVISAWFVSTSSKAFPVYSWVSLRLQRSKCGLSPGSAVCTMVFLQTRRPLTLLCALISRRDSGAFPAALQHLELK